MEPVVDLDDVSSKPRSGSAAMDASHRVLLDEMARMIAAAHNGLEERWAAKFEDRCAGVERQIETLSNQAGGLEWSLADLKERWAGTDHYIDMVADRGARIEYNVNNLYANWEPDESMAADGTAATSELEGDSGSSPIYTAAASDLSHLDGEPVYDNYDDNEVIYDVFADEVTAAIDSFHPDNASISDDTNLIPENSNADEVSDGRICTDPSPKLADLSPLNLGDEICDGDFICDVGGGLLFPTDDDNANLGLEQQQQCVESVLLPHDLLGPEQRAVGSAEAEQLLRDPAHLHAPHLAMVPQHAQSRLEVERFDRPDYYTVIKAIELGMAQDNLAAGRHVDFEYCDPFATTLVDLESFMLQPEAKEKDDVPAVFAVNQAIQMWLSCISSGMTSTYSMKCFNLHAKTGAVFMGAVCFVFDPGTGLEVCCSSDFVPWPPPFPIYIRGSDIAMRPMPWPNFSLHIVLVGDFTSYVLSSIDRVFIHNEQHQFLPSLPVVINIDYFLWTPPWFYLCGHPIRWTSVVVLMEFLGVQQFMPVIALVVEAFGWIDDASLGSGISFLSIHFAATVLNLPSNQCLLWQQQQAAFQHINFHSTADKHIILLYCFAHVLSSTIELALSFTTQDIAISWLSMMDILVDTLCSRSTIHLSGLLASVSKGEQTLEEVQTCQDFQLLQRFASQFWYTSSIISISSLLDECNSVDCKTWSPPVSSLCMHAGAYYMDVWVENSVLSRWSSISGWCGFAEHKYWRYVLHAMHWKFCDREMFQQWDPGISLLSSITSWLSVPVTWSISLCIKSITVQPSSWPIFSMDSLCFWDTQLLWLCKLLWHYLHWQILAPDNDITGYDADQLLHVSAYRPAPINEMIDAYTQDPVVCCAGQDNSEC